MARVKLSEYRAKKLLLGDSYTGWALDAAGAGLPDGTPLVVKVDQGIKKRMKQGLVALGPAVGDIPGILAGWQGKGFSRFIAEPLLPHAPEQERYLSLELVREGIRLLYAGEGGIDIEEHPEKVETHLITEATDIGELARTLDLPAEFFAQTLESFKRNYFAFLEINPLVVQEGVAHALDAAVLVDSAAQFFVKGAWTGEDLPPARAKHPAESRVNELQKTTPASLKLTVLNPDGSLFFLLSGGGGSIVIEDQAALAGLGSSIGNYGEYSGGPTREETYLYAREVIGLLLASTAPRRALIIAGGVANFTDVAKTFAGIIDALGERAQELREAGVKVFVRRGGPNEQEGLAHMKSYLEQEGLCGSVHGSDAVITLAVDEAIDFVQEKP